MKGIERGGGWKGVALGRKIWKLRGGKEVEEGTKRPTWTKQEGGAGNKFACADAFPTMERRVIFYTANGYGGANEKPRV